MSVATPNSLPQRQLHTSRISLTLSMDGGHLAPVHFRLPTGEVSPYALPPWQPEDFPHQPNVLRILRGDFFCLPFGPPEDQHELHGATANARWTLLEHSSHRLHLHLSDDTLGQGAWVEKTIHLQEDEWAIYQEHRISGADGDFTYGHHPILAIPDTPGTVQISHSPLRFASTRPLNPEHPASEITRLAPLTRFNRLEAVPLRQGGMENRAIYPPAEASEEILLLAAAEQHLAWTAVTFPGFAWIALRRTLDFPVTVLWMSHGGRSEAPWLSRHRGRLGVEDACSYFAEGLAASRQQPWLAEGVPTVRRFQRGETVCLRHLQLVVPLPEHFGIVSDIAPDPNGNLLHIRGQSHAVVTAAVNWRFLNP